MHGLRAVIRDDEERGRVVEALDQRAHLAVEVAVVGAEPLLVRVAGLVVGVVVVVEAPERVVQAVRPHLDQHQEVPRPRVAQVAREREPAPRHLVDVAQDAVLLVGAVVGDVDHVVADDPPHLVLQLLGVGELRVGARRQEAAHHLAVHRPRRERLRHAQSDDVLALAPEHVPQPVDAHLVGRREGEPVVRVVLAVPEAVEPERAGILRRHHARPRRHGDRRVARLEPPPRPALHEAREHGQLVAHVVEDDLGRHAVQAHDHELLGGRHRGHGTGGWRACPSVESPP